MKIFSFLVLALLLFWGQAQAQTTFMDLWCEYGGKECTGKTMPRPVPKPAVAAPSAPAVTQPQVAPIRHSAPLITRDASLSMSKGVTFGRYYALVIGNNRYPQLTNLKTAVIDAQEVAKTLKGHYGFYVATLINATRDDIITALDEYRKILKAEDNLLIYYAGHGWLDGESERGYWLPVDADKTTRSRWVSNADVTDTLKALKAKHVMVVADSCYAGTLTRSADPDLDGMRGLKLTEKPSGYLETLTNRKSRTVLSSGALEPVSDQGGGQHSVFAHAFLKSLKDNTDLMDGTQLFTKVRAQVLLNARQTPQYSNIRFAGHDVGGDFIFLRRD